MFLNRLKFGWRLFGIGFGLSSSYLTIQYQRTVGITTEKTAHENFVYMGRWVQWKISETLHLSEEYIAQCCHWCSHSPLFHYLDITSFLIFLGNRKNIFLHNLGVKLLASIQFPLDIEIDKYINKCSHPVIVGLARSDPFDSKWFTVKDYDNDVFDDEMVKGKIDNILSVISTVLGDKAHDPCSIWLFERVVQNILPPDPVPNSMADLSVGRDDIEFSTITEIEFSENVLTYLEILRRYSNNPVVSSNASIAYEILQVLKYISYKYADNSSILVTCGNIIANLAVDENNCKLIVELDILDLVMKWKKTPFVSLQITASRILNNLDVSCRNNSNLHEGIYILHPENRCNQSIDIDIVFIHGIWGSPFYTWRQKDTVNGDYTYCWPKDWLSLDYPNTRIVSVEYNSQISDWHLACPLSKDEYSLDMQAANIRRKLLQCGIGKRPIVWVTHSMGGLLVKKILVDFLPDDILKLTEGIVFYSVPHLGSPIATHSEKASYILFPSTEVNELSENSSGLKELHQKFSDLLNVKKIDCIDFGETQPLSLPYIKLKSLVVPRFSSDVGYGRYLLADANHQDICKPLSKSDAKYLEVVSIVEGILKKHVPFKVKIGSK